MTTHTYPTESNPTGRNREKTCCGGTRQGWQRRMVHTITPLGIGKPCFRQRIFDIVLDVKLDVEIDL